MKIGEKSEFLGKCLYPFHCGNYIFHVFTNQNALLPDYSVIGDCCQLYFWCRCPCDKCEL